jgi:hypothetical protein
VVRHAWLYPACSASALWTAAGWNRVNLFFEDPQNRAKLPGKIRAQTGVEQTPFSPSENPTTMLYSKGLEKPCRPHSQAIPFSFASGRR